MKIKVKAEPQVLEALAASDCALRSREVAVAKCGVAFAMFSVQDDRMKRAGIKTVPESDIHSGLTTAASVLERLQNRMLATSPDSIMKSLKPIRSEIVKIKNQFKYDGKRKIGGREAVELHTRLSKIHGKIDEVLGGIDRVCQASSLKSTPKPVQ